MSIIRYLVSNNLVRNESYHKNDVINKSIMGVFSEILIYIPKNGKHITGEHISGIVKFHLDEDTEYKNIALSLVEEGECEWYEFKSHNGRLSNKKTVFRGYEKKVIAKCYFLNKFTDENITLRAGTYEHPFNIMIPENTPPTVKTSIGEIKYKLVLKFKKPETFSWNKTYKRTITIYPRIDSSLSDKPIIATRNKTLIKLFSSKKHEIVIKAELDKGYLNPCGERNVSFVVNNNSDIMFSVMTELISKTKYTAYYKTISKTKVIHSSTVESPKIPDNSVSNMFNIIPVAPEICTVRHSGVIEREYKLRITMKLPLPHVNSSVEIPVFVGESPVTCNIVNGEEAAGSSEPMEAPPSYWETMQEDKKKDD